MAVNEITKIGRAFRKLIDKESNLWYKLSFWTSSKDVEFEDGKSAEDKVGNINGITSDVNRSDNDIASSILPVHNIKSNLDQGIINDNLQFVFDEDGNLGWKKVGADTVNPFSSFSKDFDGSEVEWTNFTGSTIFSTNDIYLLICTTYAGGSGDAQVTKQQFVNTIVNSIDAYFYVDAFYMNGGTGIHMAIGKPKSSTISVPSHGYKKYIKLS